MCSEEFRKRLIEEKYLTKWVSKRGTWKWHEDGTVSVTGNVDVKGSMFKLPVKFRKVNGYFNCASVGLFTLEGCPGTVSQDFYCSWNYITSLEYSPKFVGEGFWCHSNPHTFTRADVRKVCIVKGNIVES